MCLRAADESQAHDARLRPAACRLQALRRVSISRQRAVKLLPKASRLSLVIAIHAAFSRHLRPSVKAIYRLRPAFHAHILDDDAR